VPSSFWKFTKERAAVEIQNCQKESRALSFAKEEKSTRDSADGKEEFERDSTLHKILYKLERLSRRQEPIAFPTQVSFVSVYGIVNHLIRRAQNHRRNAVKRDSSPGAVPCKVKAGGGGLFRGNRREQETQNSSKDLDSQDRSEIVVWH